MFSSYMYSTAVFDAHIDHGFVSCHFIVYYFNLPLPYLDVISSPKNTFLLGKQNENL